MTKEVSYMEYLISLIKEDYKTGWSEDCDWVYTCYPELVQQKQWMEEDPHSELNEVICNEFYSDMKNNKEWSNILKIDVVDIVSFDDFTYN